MFSAKSLARLIKVTILFTGILLTSGVFLAHEASANPL
jgi:hypothetical protein